MSSLYRVSMVVEVDFAIDVDVDANSAEDAAADIQALFQDMTWRCHVHVPAIGNVRPLSDDSN